MEMKHKCWGGLDGIYKWYARIKNPKSCPRCKARLDSKKSAEARAKKIIEDNKLKNK